MQRSLALALLLLAALAGGCRAWSLLDPSDVVGDLSAPGAGVEGDLAMDKWKKPDFCGKMDCPPFKTRKHTDNYDIRKYEGGKWLLTSVNDTKFELAYTRGAARLLKYFSGSNDKSAKFDVTTPTLAELHLDKEGKAKDRNYSFSLWLPEAAQEDTPQPTDGEVKVAEFPSITVFVRVFSGFATEGTIIDETRGLHEVLQDEDEEYDGRVVWAAVYDPPQKLINRHNEIHVPYSAKKLKPT